MRPENQAVAHRLGFFWFKLQQWQLLGRNDEDEVLVDGFVYAWSYGQVRVLPLLTAPTQPSARLWRERTEKCIHKTSNI